MILGFHQGGYLFLWAADLAMRYAGRGMNITAVSLTAGNFDQAADLRNGPADDCRDQSADVCCLSETESGFLVGTLSDGRVAVWNVEL